jgi:hypothetical protein
MNTNELLHFPSVEERVIVATVEYLNAQRVNLDSEDPDFEPEIKAESITLQSRLMVDLHIGEQIGITELQAYIEYVARRCDYPIVSLEIWPLEKINTFTIQDVCALIETLEVEEATQAEEALL